MKGIIDAYKTAGNHNEDFTASDRQSKTAFKSQMSANTHTNTHRGASGDFHCLPSNTKVLLINAQTNVVSTTAADRQQHRDARTAQ